MCTFLFVKKYPRKRDSIFIFKLFVGNILIKAIVTYVNVNYDSFVISLDLWS